MSDTPRIDIIIIRDPDSETRLMVYLDGKPAHTAQWHIDPGVGYTHEDWEEMREENVQKAPEYLRDDLDSLYERFNKSKYFLD